MSLLDTIKRRTENHPYNLAMMRLLTKHPEDFNLNNPGHSHMIYSTSRTPAPQLITDSQHPESINTPTLQHRGGFWIE